MNKAKEATTPANKHGSKPKVESNHGLSLMLSSFTR